MSIFTFDNQTFTLTNYGTTENIYFKATEVARFLGYINTTQAIRQHVWITNKTSLDENHQKNNPAILTGSKNQHLYLISTLINLISR